jgi:hypothetical protein
MLNTEWVLHMDALPQLIHDLIERVDHLQASVDDLRQQRTAKEFYTTAEFAKIVGRAEFTVREWCRHRRIHGEKRDAGRGENGEWKISHAELVRYQSHGLLPVPSTSTRI